jgi:hypothetical protein
MKAFVSESLICALALGMIFVGSLNAQTPSASADTTRYGPYPSYYKEIIMHWLNKQFHRERAKSFRRLYRQAKTFCAHS